jgi:hypothetical protein
MNPSIFLHMSILGHDRFARSLLTNKCDGTHISHDQGASGGEFLDPHRLG